MGTKEFMIFLVFPRRSGISRAALAALVVLLVSGSSLLPRACFGQIVPIDPVSFFNVELQPGYSMLSYSLDPILTHAVAGVLGTDGRNCLSVTKLNSAGNLETTFFTPGLGWSDTTMVLSPGEGCVAWNPNTNRLTVTVVGRVLAGYLTNDIPAGLSMCGPLLPHSGKLGSDHAFPSSEGDRVYFLKPNGSYNEFVYEGGQWNPTEPTVGVGQAFWVKKSQPAKWVRYFSYGSAESNHYVRPNAAGPNVSTSSLHEAMPNLPEMPGRVIRVAARTAVLEAGTRNEVPTAYRWQRNGIPLSDGESISGTQSGTLVISDIQPGEHEGLYSVIATNLAGSVKALVADLRIVPPATLPPVFSAAERPSQAGFAQSIQVEAGRYYVVQTSSDLQNWVELTNFVSAGTSASFLDAAASSISRRFYRVISP